MTKNTILRHYLRTTPKHNHIRLSRKISNKKIKITKPKTKADNPDNM